jgi:WD40 repeat protein
MPTPARSTFAVRIFLLAVSVMGLTAVSGAGSLCAQAQPTNPSEADIRSAPPATAATNVVAFSPDGTRIATVTTANVIAIWEVDTGELLTTLPGQDGYMSTVDWSPDGTRLASGSNDGTVQIWNVADQTLERTFDGFDALDRAFGGAGEVAFSPDGRYLAGAQSDPTGRLIVWRLSDGQTVLQTDASGGVYDVMWGSDGTTLYAGQQDGALHSWSFPEAQKTGRQSFSDQRIVNAAVRKPLAAAGGEGEELIVRTLDRDAEVWRFSDVEFVNEISFVPGRPLVAVTDGRGDLKVWNLDDGTLHLSRFTHDSIAYFVRASPDGTLLATVGQDNYVRLWDPDSGELVREIRGR